MLDCQRLLELDRALPRFPEAGQTLGDFRLLAEIGRGAVGRVFLALQPSLADRPVVLKLTRCDSQEYLSLARLQHTHIVPLHAVQDDPTRNLRLLCMPYFGGASLARVLEVLKDQPVAQRSGQDILDALDQAQAREVAIPTMGPDRQFLGRASYVQAVCWMGACLADALHYAHEHGLVHLDLKPSNVLLAADAQPMLLDFHLAHEPIQAGAQAPDRMGGTVEYLSPEQRLALEAVRKAQVVPMTVDGRSDVYSLGLLLYEALAGTRPAPGMNPGARCHRANPRVSVGLADLIARCLAREAGSRSHRGQPGGRPAAAPGQPSVARRAQSQPDRTLDQVAPPAALCPGPAEHAPAHRGGAAGRGTGRAGPVPPARPCSREAAARERAPAP